MEKRICTIERNSPVAPGCLRMSLTAEESLLHRCGQFVEVAVPGQYLRRPVSVSLSEEGRLTLLYKVVGKGTAALAALKPGDKLDLLTGLGNGFDSGACRGKALLVGGGIVGNSIDRLWRGAVVDFFDFTFGTYHYPIFNVADCAICVGVFIYLLSSFLRKPRQPETPDAENAETKKPA